jgi:hypothetical protein
MSSHKDFVHKLIETDLLNYCTLDSAAKNYENGNYHDLARVYYKAAETCPKPPLDKPTLLKVIHATRCQNLAVRKQLLSELISIEDLNYYISDVAPEYIEELCEELD